MKRLTEVCVLVGAILIAGGAASATPTVVEFSEVDLPDLTLLDGTSYFVPWGISFQDTTDYAVDSRLIGAGIDDRGITTTSGPDNLMTVVFNNPVKSLHVDFVTLFHSDIYGTLYDAGGNPVGAFSVVNPPDPYYGWFEYTNTVPIVAKASFHDDIGYIGVGRLEYDQGDIIPAPGAIVLAGIGATVVGWLGRRRTV